MQPTVLLLLLLGAAIVGSTTATSSNSTSANQVVSSREGRTGGRGGYFCCNGTEEILQSIRDLADGVGRLASAIESSNTMKCEHFSVAFTQDYVRTYSIRNRHYLWATIISSICS